MNRQYRKLARMPQWACTGKTGIDSISSEPAGLLFFFDRMDVLRKV
jgi:hypothetical protein